MGGVSIASLCTLLSEIWVRLDGGQSFRDSTQRMNIAVHFLHSVASRFEGGEERDT